MTARHPEALGRYPGASWVLWWMSHPAVPEGAPMVKMLMQGLFAAFVAAFFAAAATTTAINLLHAYRASQF